MLLEFIDQLVSHPIWVGLIVGLLLYVLKTRSEAQALACALIADINQIRNYSDEIFEYLRSDIHYWLKAGATITRAPTHTGPEMRLVMAVLPNLHLLSKRDVSKVLGFYLHHQLCENLTKSLYRHIRSYTESDAPLTDADVRILALRRDRLLSGYESLLSGADLNIVKLRQLPDSYSITSTQSIARQLNHLHPEELGQASGRQFPSEEDEMHKYSSPAHDPSPKKPKPAPGQTKPEEKQQKKRK